VLVTDVTATDRAVEPFTDRGVDVRRV
jgi:hypothetical protein